MAKGQLKPAVEGIYPAFMEGISLSEDTLQPGADMTTVKVQELVASKQLELEKKVEKMRDGIFDTMKALHHELCFVKRKLSDCQEQSAKFEPELTGALDRAEDAECKLASIQKELDADRKLAGDRDRRFSELETIFKELQLGLERRPCI